MKQMKLRLFGNSIRIRLSQDEVRELAAGRPIQASTRFFDGQLDIDLSPSAGAATSASCADGRIRIQLHAEETARWAYSEEEGLYASDGVSTLAVEKDYACLHKTKAANEGTFPNPSARID